MDFVAQVLPMLCNRLALTIIEQMLQSLCNAKRTPNHTKAIHQFWQKPEYHIIYIGPSSCLRPLGVLQRITVAFYVYHNPCWATSPADSRTLSSVCCWNRLQFFQAAAQSQKPRGAQPAWAAAMTACYGGSSDSQLPVPVSEMLGM